ncbi:hypothetical protein [Candidatus Parabeggiatoa sp. HSG14]|uniref:hypothetical protein n=1 Tax=Candidatus Parabeggiatoa sp. HSG14 TaxID=3055593 RepID=UPI0025A90925|nr:hypothetical protein [Thiotrichales bacterium HSG14]
MNLYFLVEGKTERKVYPHWLSHLLPNFSRVDCPDEVSENNYFLISGGGFPSLLDVHFKSSVEDINDSGKYDFLVVCLDSDEESPEVKMIMVHDFIKNNKLTISCELKIIVQKKCMETWFMGNQTIYPRNISVGFKPFSKFYNVLQNDPELMWKPEKFEESCSIYHYEYLRYMLLEKRIRYSKTNPKDVTKEYYLQELKKRVSDTPHLNTLKIFLDFCDSLAKIT